jgi:CubicO group peptidase (beta-lactamase class C family)
LNENLTSQINLLEKYIIENMKKEDIPGISYAIIFNDEVVFANSYGYSDKENKIKTTLDTIFPIFSITKLFTAIMCMQINEKNIINIDDPIKKYLNDLNLNHFFKDKNPLNITFRHLISHTSGLPREAPLNYWISNKFPSTKEVLNSINNIELNFKPGTNYHYSNLGIVLLASILEKVINMNYEDYIVQEILIPLKMFNSGFDLKKLNNNSSISKIYTELNFDSLPNMNAFKRSGGLYSNIKDLSKFLSLQFKYDSNQNEILNSNTIFQMHKPQFILEDWSGGMGLGWALNKIKNYSTIRHSGGLLNGVSSNITAIPKLKFGTIILTNKDTQYLVEDLAYKSIEYLIPFFEEIKANNNNKIISLNLYEGFYKFDYFPNNYKFEIKALNNTLLAFFPDAGPLKKLNPVKFIPLGNDHFLMKNWFLPFFEDELCHFKKDYSGNIIGIYISGFYSPKLN